MSKFKDLAFDPINGRSPIDIESPKDILRQANANLDLAKSMVKKMSSISSVEGKAAVRSAVGLMLNETANQVCYEFQKNIAATRLISGVTKDLMSHIQSSDSADIIQNSVLGIKHESESLTSLFDIIAETKKHYIEAGIPTYALDSILALEGAYLNHIVSNTLDES